MSIFDSSGRINPDIDPASISPDRRSQYVALASAQRECERADSELKAANDAVVECVREHDHAQAALPKSDFMSEWRRSK
jgi:hypothetical protein